MNTDERSKPILHRHLAVLEVTDPTVLDRLHQHPALRQHLWYRLDDHHTVIPAHQVTAITQALAALELPPSFPRMMDHGA